MVSLVADLAAELGCRRPTALAEQLVTLADGGGDPPGQRPAGHGLTGPNRPSYGGR
jgi:hypothetical protein